MSIIVTVCVCVCQFQPQLVLVCAGFDAAVGDVKVKTDLRSVMDDIYD